MLSVGHCHLGTKGPEMTLSQASSLCHHFKAKCHVRAIDTSSLQDSLSLLLPTLSPGSDSTPPSPCVVSSPLLLLPSPLLPCLLLLQSLCQEGMNGVFLFSLYMLF